MSEVQSKVVEIIVDKLGVKEFLFTTFSTFSTFFKLTDSKP